MAKQISRREIDAELQAFVIEKEIEKAEQEAEQDHYLSDGFYDDLDELYVQSELDLYRQGSYPKSLKKLRRLIKQDKALSQEARSDISNGFLLPVGYDSPIYLSAKDHREALELIDPTPEERNNYRNVDLARAMAFDDAFDGS